MKLDQNQIRSYRTEHEIKLRGSRTVCRVITEEVPFTDEQGEIAATAFLYTYLGNGGEGAPVIFAFNGGPGSSCVWEHLGLFGAVRVKLDDSTNPSLSAPYELEDNPYCLLDCCDVVMIDPPGCGYGQLLKAEAGGSFFGVLEDAKCMADLIEDWVIRYGRIASPKYLVGESYGTIRSCMLLSELMGGPMSAGRRLRAIPIDGVIMLGTAICMDYFHNRPAVEEAVLQLPGMACVNLYHHPLDEGKKQEWTACGLPVPDCAAKAADIAWKFAGEQYLPALFQGSGLSEDKRRLLVRQMSLLTGVEEAWFERHGLNLPVDVFLSEVLAGEGKDAGAYDGRYTMRHLDPVQMKDPVADDPAMGKYTAAFIGAMNGKMKEYLGLAKMNRPYDSIDFEVNGRWNYQTPRTPDECLEWAMRRNEGLRVFFGSGLYDMVTPPGTVRYLQNHLSLPKERVTVKEYESGHMPYLGDGPAARLYEDLREFILS